MPLYQPDVVTLWVIQADHPERIEPLLAFGFGENGERQPSPFAQAYRTGWYDEDFTEVFVGNTIEKLLEGAAVYYRTLDEQALSWVPAGDWNAIYLICGGAGAV